MVSQIFHDNNNHRLDHESIRKKIEILRATTVLFLILNGTSQGNELLTFSRILAN
jgi:hypothetical protein